MDEATRPAHLVPVASSRGFAYMPELKGTYRDAVKVYESSAATEPCVWLRVKEGDYSATAHVTAEVAWAFAEQIMTVVRDHYHGDARPTAIRVADFVEE